MGTCQVQVPIWVVLTLQLQRMLRRDTRQVLLCELAGVLAC